MGAANLHSAIDLSTFDDRVPDDHNCTCNGYSDGDYARRDSTGKDDKCRREEDIDEKESEESVQEEERVLLTILVSSFREQIRDTLSLGLPAQLNMYRPFWKSLIHNVQNLSRAF